MNIIKAWILKSIEIKNSYLKSMQKIENNKSMHFFYFIGSQVPQKTDKWYNDNNIGRKN